MKTDVRNKPTTEPQSQIERLQLALWEQEINDLRDEIEETTRVRPPAGLPAHELESLRQIQESRYC